MTIESNTLSKQQFNAYLAEGYNKIPLMREIFSDFDTPLSIYLKLANSAYSFLFESIRGGDQWGRYSIIGLPAKTVIKVTDHNIVILETQNNSEVSSEQSADPLEWIKQFQKQYQVPNIPTMPRFFGGLVGYFGYEIIGYIEKRLANSIKKDSLNTPDILLMIADEVVIFDTLTGRLHLVVHASTNQYEEAINRLDELTNQLQQPLNTYNSHAFYPKTTEQNFKSIFTEKQYKQAVNQAKKYINSGDIMQVVLSQRMSIDYEAPPLDIYRALRSINPSPYMYFLHLDAFQIVGSSPEILVRLEDNTVTVRPIAGTRPRGNNEEQDQQLEKELLNDPKELAEHLMLIDLGRNDAGRVSQIGSIKLTEKMLVERYSHVMHIVSNVTGKLLPEHDAIDVLRATFPAGTLSGAPKIRAMEIIEELEPIKRGIYSGAIGYLAWNGNMDTAIAIRTAIIKNKQLHIQAGAGIVYDSQAQNEWDETLNKGRAIFEAVNLANTGLDTINSTKR